LYANGDLDLLLEDYLDLLGEEDLALLEEEVQLERANRQTRPRLLE